MKVTLKNQEIQDLSAGLHACGDLKGIKFAYAIVKNKKHCDSALHWANEKMLKIQKQSEEYAKYEEERIEIAKNCSKKDETGEPVTEFNQRTYQEQYVIEDKKMFTGLMAPLKKKYADAIKEHEEKVKEAQKVPDEEVEIELHMIPQEYIPVDITANQLNGIQKIIKEG